jgi:hypothetical protein
VCTALDCCAYRHFSTHIFIYNIYSYSVCVGIIFLITVSNWSLNILILWKEADSELTVCGWYQLNYFLQQNSATHFCFTLNRQTLVKAPQYVSTLLIRTVNLQNFVCNYSKPEIIQFHFFAINQVLCMIMRSHKSKFLFVYMKWTDGWNLQFMISSLKAVSQIKRIGTGLDAPWWLI